MSTCPGCTGDPADHPADAMRWRPDLLNRLEALAAEWEACAVRAAERGHPSPDDALTFAQEHHAAALRAVVAAVPADTSR